MMRTGLFGNRSRATHCGAGCAIGDLTTERIVFAAPTVLMMIGRATTFPINWWLIHKRCKEAM